MRRPYCFAIQSRKDFFNILPSSPSPPPQKKNPPLGFLPWTRRCNLSRHLFLPLPSPKPSYIVVAIEALLHSVALLITHSAWLGSVSHGSPVRNIGCWVLVPVDKQLRLNTSLILNIHSKTTTSN